MPNNNVLTDEQIMSIWRAAPWPDRAGVISFARALLAAHPGQPEPRIVSAIPRVHSVKRFADNPCTVLMMLMAEATDDALRAIHDRLTCQPEPRAEVIALIAAAENVVSADRACALDDSDINSLAAAIDAGRTGKPK
ncbi:hypothetical protein QZM82_06440 [Burkholderia cepacia]|uniref:hypothetical protein n=1 Tax=Burkholderia cepacia TaxID=292 RepID=UPI002656EDD8|nr:hypothetical protein [Burkholderia cepacia]MDN7895831.1 hypothetical protein [Burkholderia cepacia]